MGLSVELVIGEIDEDLLCSICKNVLIDPVQDPHEHYFCKECITTWLSNKPICPLDNRTYVRVQDMRPASRLVRNILSKYKVKCENSLYGCKKIVLYDFIKTHDKDCEFKPTKIIDCPYGCEARFKLCDFKLHNCTKELKKGYREQLRETNRIFSRVMKLETENAINKETMVRMFREQNDLKAKISQLEKIVRVHHKHDIVEGQMKKKREREETAAAVASAKGFCDAFTTDDDHFLDCIDSNRQN